LTNSCKDTETSSCPPPTKFEIGKPLLLIRERQIAKVLKRESREAVCKKSRNQWRGRADKSLVGKRNRTRTGTTRNDLSCEPFL
jgi:hypothetical protein